MSHFSFLLLSFFILPQALYSQKKWDGGGGNNLWSNALNWTGNTLPTATDNVILDNSIITANYSVVLPSTAVTVKTITIAPNTGRIVELTLPATNTLAPGFRALGPGYGMILNSGAVFRNNSGLASGSAVLVADSIKINNDGKYIHQTPGSHSANVQALSTAPGTETGIFEFDIPTASSTISLSGRIFGRLSLKATAAGGVCNYTAAGTSRVVVRSHFDLGAGVNASLNFSDTISVAGNFTQQSGTLNLGNSTRSVVLHVLQNFVQNTGGIITETGTGIQSIVLGGSGVQLFSIRGSWLNQVALVRVGGGIALLKTTLSLPYKLVLQSGSIVTTSTWLLTLQAGCSIQTDSLSGNAFIDGPLKKEGMSNSDFLFPVGKTTQMRWLRLEKATGTFTVEYFKTDPNTLSSVNGSGLHHISSVEYWDVLTLSGGTATVKLSFVDPISGGVTSLPHLRVARLMNGTWQNAGSASYSGSPGSNGWVSSATVSGFSASTKSFALASAIGQENPLPLVDLSFSARLAGDRLQFKWRIGNDEDAGYFELQESNDGIRFTTFEMVYAEKSGKEFVHQFTPRYVSRYYRVRYKSENGTVWYESLPSKIDVANGRSVTLAGGNIVRDRMCVTVNTRSEVMLEFLIRDALGNVLVVNKERVRRGQSFICIATSGLKPGVYYLVESSGQLKGGTLRFVKI